jgi:DNA-binding MarR family transcriptional regulator
MNRKAKPSKEQLERIAGVLRGIGEQIALMREMIASHFDLQRSDRAGLDFIYSRGGTCTAGELSRATGLTSGSTTALIDRLERAGYAVREPDRQDRRKQIIRIPERVLADCEALYEPIRKELFKLWSSYSAGDLQLVEEFLRRSIQLHAACVERAGADASDAPQHRGRSLQRTRSRS